MLTLIRQIFVFFSVHREIAKEIQRLRIEQERQSKLSISNDVRNHGNPTLLAELRLLRQRRDELEFRMSSLQESRKDLMMQLESLMKLLKVRIRVKVTKFKVRFIKTRAITTTALIHL